MTLKLLKARHRFTRWLVNVTRRLHERSINKLAAAYDKD